MKTIKLSPSGKSVPCEDGLTILAALEKNGIVLPNNCRAGACGECKTKVLKGKFDQGFILDMALSKSEREEGLGLMCMAKPLDEVIEIEFGSRSILQKLYPPQENLSFIVIEKNLVTPKIMKLRLRALGPSMKFWPGQYIMLGNPKRAYSIANCPNEEGEIILLITKAEDGWVSRWIHDDVKVGEKLKIDGPYGSFIGNLQSDLPVLCLASGSGIAPILSLSSAALLRGGFKRPATVLYSAKSKEEVVERGLFSYLEARFRNFRFMPTLTQEERPGFLKGRVTEILPDLFSDLSGMEVYISGSVDFVEDCKNLARKLGAPDEQIHTESFFKNDQGES